MARIAENTVIVDGQEYKPGDVIPDFKSIKCVDTREPRKYQGLSADVSVLNDVIAKYASGGASCFMSDTGEYYEYDRKEKTWKLITNITERGFDSEKAYGALKHMLKNVTVSDEKIQSAVTNYLTVNPVLPGATTEQAQQIEQNKTDVAALKEETGSLKEDIGNKISQLESVCLYESENKFDVDLQTEETISPHYYVNGNPYSSTQFDNTWHCTAPIEIKPNTTYSIGCVPSISGVVKPWNNSVEGIFMYDKNMEYIGKINATSFTTPSNAKYIRFNYYITFSGYKKNVALQRCVLVESDILPTEYVPYKKSNIKEDLINLSKDVEQILGDKIGFAYTIDFSASKLIVSYKYTNDTDCQVVFAIGGGNNLMDIRGIYMYENPNAPIVNELSFDNIWIYMNGDNFAPFQIRANSNIDGDNKNNDGSYKIFFTGGNHQYNNTGTGSTSTAHCQNIKFFIDNYEVKHDKKGYANKLKLTWENLVQGYNTTKADGTGRAILKERHSVIFDGISFYCHTELIPLEDITCDRWYGYQLIHSDKYNKCQYVDGTNREVYDRNANTKCGDKKAKKLRIFNDSTEDCADVELSDFDIGNRDLFNGDNGIFNTDYGKAYFNIINGSKVLNKNNVYTLDATYTFHKWFV